MRAWIPKQHGVWAMLVAPALCGGIVVGFTGWHALLILAWVLAYLCLMSVRGWLRDIHHVLPPPYLVIPPKAGSPGHKPTRYRIPSLTYAAAGLVCVVALLLFHPGLLFWGIPLAVILGASLALISTGHERSVANDALLIASSCLISVVAFTLSGTRSLSLISFLASIAKPRAWLIASIFAGYLWGTIFYVKTMIRERGKPGWRIASVVYHALCVAPAFLVNPWVGAVSLLALLRAGSVPRLWPRAKPKAVGFGEVALTTILVLVVCLTV